MAPPETLRLAQTPREEMGASTSCLSSISADPSYRSLSRKLFCHSALGERGKPHRVDRGNRAGSEIKAIGSLIPFVGELQRQARDGLRGLEFRPGVLSGVELGGCRILPAAVTRFQQPSSAPLTTWPPSGMGTDLPFSAVPVLSLRDPLWGGCERGPCSA